MNKSASNFNRILIIATRQIGDVLCTTPLMRRARELWPDAVIDVLGYEKTMGMLSGNPDINEVIESPEHPKWPQYERLIKRIFRKYDLAIIAQPSDRAHLYGLLAASKRVGVVSGGYGQTWWKRWLSGAVIERDLRRQHMVVEGLRLLSDFGGNHFPLQARVIPPWTASTLPLEAQLGRRYVVIHPCSLGRFKLWPPENWGLLIRELLSRQFKVALTGSDSPSDREVIRNILSHLDETELRHISDLCGVLSLSELTPLIESAAFFIGVDTSVTHQAAATGVKTIALYGPTNPVNFGPWPVSVSLPTPLGCYAPWQSIGGGEGLARFQTYKNVLILQGRQACVPCMQKGCDRRDDSGSECLDSIGATDVFATLRAFVDVD